MEHQRTQIWDFLFKSEPQTTHQIAEALGLNQVMVTMAVDHEWFVRRGETVAIATNEVSSSGTEQSGDV